MDLQRDPVIVKRKRRRQASFAALFGLGVLSLTVVVSRLEPALPSVTESTLWFGAVRRGPMVRQVRGSGTLVPEEIRWITATTTGRVDRVVLQPGARVEPGTVILQLANADLK